VGQLRTPIYRPDPPGPWRRPGAHVSAAQQL